MPNCLRQRWLPALFLLVLCQWTSLPAFGSSYGKNLVRSVDLPLKELARFEVFNRSPTNKEGKPKTSIGLITDTEDWVDEELAVRSDQSPYKIVVKTHGIAKFDGDALVRWQPTWMGLPSPISPQTTKSVKAGQPVELVTVSGPVSFRKDETVLPALLFVRSDNMAIDRVQVEVWSGIGESSTGELVMSFRYVWMGLIMIGVFFFMRRL